MRNIFKRTKSKGFLGTCNSFLQIFFWPITKLRDITIPMSDEEDWSRLRAAILPMTQLLAFFYLFGMLNDIGDDDEDDHEAAMAKLIAGLAWIVPGAIMGFFIYTRVKNTEPPNWLMNVFAVVAFVQSIAWINFASDSIVDLLKIFGFILSLP